jgi:hypothetical protein
MFQATGGVRGKTAGIRQGNATGEAARPMKAAQFVARRVGRTSGRWPVRNRHAFFWGTWSDSRRGRWRGRSARGCRTGTARPAS